MSRRANGEGTLYRLPDGRWRVSITVTEDGVRRRISRVRQKRADAVAVLAELRADTPQRSATTSSLTVGKMLDKWLSLHVDRKTSTSTRDGYHRAVRKHIRPTLGDVPLKKLTPFRVTEFLAALETAGTKPRAIQAAFQTLRTALNFAVHPMGVIAANPCQQIATPTHEPRTIQPFEVNEIKAILAEVSGTRWEAFFSVAFGTGLRWGEMAGLTWEQVDLESRLIRVDRQLRDVSGRREEARPKTKSSIRTVAIPDATAAALRNHKSILMREGNAGRPHVFPGVRGGTLCRSNWHREVWTILLGLLEIPQRGVHHTRHTFATQSLAAGVPVADVAKALGHSSPAITLKVYAHALESNDRAAASAMDRLIG